MSEKVLKSHPSKYEYGKRVPYEVCKSNTGWSISKRQCRHSDLKDMGSGVTLYFKFTKYLILLYLFLSVITVPHVVFYIYGGTEDYNKSKTITSFFGLTTLGNLGSAYNM